MSNTLRFNMPLLDAAQAQKHVTVNEALVRADVLAAGRVESRSLSSPPATPVDGTAYIVGQGATGDWAGEENAIALFLNGGWAFLPPWTGAKFWVQDDSADAIFADGGWKSSALAVSLGAAATLATIIEIDHDLSSGTVSTTPAVIPDKAVVIGITGRVIAEIVGPSNWSLGVAGSADRYGSGYGLSVGSFAHGVTGQPQAYFGPTSLEITSNGAPFSAGTLRLAVHCLSLSPPKVA